jgi:hypothetical protein
MKRDELISKLIQLPSDYPIELSVNGEKSEITDIIVNNSTIIFECSTAPKTGTIAPEEQPETITTNTPPQPVKLGANVGPSVTQGKGNWFAGTTWG